MQCCMILSRQTKCWAGRTRAFWQKTEQLLALFYAQVTTIITQHKEGRAINNIHPLPPSIVPRPCEQDVRHLVNSNRVVGGWVGGVSAVILQQVPSHRNNLGAAGSGDRRKAHVSFHIRRMLDQSSSHNLSLRCHAPAVVFVQVIVQGWPGEGKTTTVLQAGLALYDGREVDSTYVGSFRDVAKEEDVDAA
jgi:hypothetical protein